MSTRRPGACCRNLESNFFIDVGLFGNVVKWEFSPLQYLQRTRRPKKTWLKTVRHFSTQHMLNFCSRILMRRNSTLSSSNFLSLQGSRNQVTFLARQQRELGLIYRNGEIPGKLVCQGELDFGVMELFDVVSLAEGRCNCGCLDNLYARKPHSVPGSHFLHKITSFIHTFHSLSYKDGHRIWKMFSHFPNEFRVITSIRNTFGSVNTDRFEVKWGTAAKSFWSTISIDKRLQLGDKSANGYLSRK